VQIVGLYTTQWQEYNFRKHCYQWCSLADVLVAMSFLAPVSSTMPPVESTISMGLGGIEVSQFAHVYQVSCFLTSACLSP
jgi:hypothetical protein